MKNEVILTAILRNEPNVQQCNYIIALKHERCTMALSFGDKVWYLQKDSVEQLMNFCKAALDYSNPTTVDLTLPVHVPNAENPSNEVRKADESLPDYR